MDTSRGASRSRPTTEELPRRCRPSLSPWLAAGSLLVSALTYSCSDEPLSVPTREVGQPAAPVSVGAGGDGGGLGSFVIPTPETNRVTVPWTSTGIEIPDGVAALVTASGELCATTARQRALFPDPPSPPPGGGCAGPAGWGATELRPGGHHVQVQLRRATGAVTVELMPRSQYAQITQGFVQGPGTLYVARLQSWGGEIACYFTPRPNETCADGSCPLGLCSIGAADYEILRTQLLEVVALPPPVATPDQTRVQAGETVNFVVSVPWTTDFVTTSDWAWVPEPSVYPVRSARLDGGCRRGHTTCSVRVQEPGFVRVRVAAPGGSVFWVESPVIGVGPPEPERELVVEVAPQTAQVEPVLDREFNAVTQHWSDSDTPRRLGDLVNLTVKATWSPSGEPASGASIEWSVKGVEGSGGHLKSHGTTRPVGTFFRVEDPPTAGDQKKGVLNPSLELTAGEDGASAAVYRTSGVSGEEVITVRVKAEDQSAEADVQVAIRYGPLVQVSREGGTYYFEGAANSHHPAENYLAPGVFEVMDMIWGTYISMNAQSPDRFPLDPVRFKVDGASLVWGGLYDVSQDWRNPHRLHRTGRDVDFNNVGAEGAPAAMKELCALTFFEGHVTVCQLHDPGESNAHYHALVGQTLKETAQNPGGLP